MIVDNQLTFSDVQVLTGTAASTNSIDLGSIRQIGVGYPMAILVTVGVSADFTTTDETYSINIQTDDNSAFSSPATVSTNVITAANLTAGSIAVIAVPTSGLERFVRVNYVLGGTTPSVTVSAFLLPYDSIQRAPYHYANNSVIA